MLLPGVCLWLSVDLLGQAIQHRSGLWTLKVSPAGGLSTAAATHARPCPALFVSWMMKLIRVQQPRQLCIAACPCDLFQKWCFLQFFAAVSPRTCLTAQRSRSARSETAEDASSARTDVRPKSETRTHRQRPAQKYFITRHREVSSWPSLRPSVSPRLPAAPKCCCCTQPHQIGCETSLTQTWTVDRAAIGNQEDHTPAGTRAFVCEKPDTQAS